MFHLNWNSFVTSMGDIQTCYFVSVEEVNKPYTVKSILSGFPFIFFSKI